MYRVGIDVGGTNTDVALLDGNAQLIESVKVPTSSNIQQGIQEAICAILTKSRVRGSEIAYIMLGTTQCANAIVECKKLVKVCTLRLGYPATAAVDPFTLWPEPLVQAVKGDVLFLEGGYEFNGKPLTRFDEEKVSALIRTMQSKFDAFAVTSVFSSVRNEQELQVERIIRKELGGKVTVSLSHHIGSMGLIERENATILNSALSKVVEQCIDGFENAIKANGIHDARLFLCQNDGTLMSLEHARKFPIFTVASGLTNSIRGASFLEKRQNALVIDVGGTTSDIGVIASGYPRESSLAVEIGGIRTNFRMPDFISVGLGGGSRVREVDGEIVIGPDSVGHDITTEALVFGGNTLTTTDIAVRLGMAEIGDKDKVAHLEENFAKRVMQIISNNVSQLIEKMRTSEGDIEVILVGGGSIIIPNQIEGIANFSRPQSNAVANAIGAAIGQVSGTHEQLYNLDEIEREVALQEITRQASDKAILAGAEKNSLVVVEQEEVHLAYHEGNTIRMKVKVVGNL